MAYINSLKKQAGVTLIEISAALVIAGLVIAGALAMFNSADMSQKSNQMLTDIAGIRIGVRGLYAASGGYGTTSLNSVLISSKKLPGSLSISGTETINHTMGGTVTVTGTTSGFKIDITNLPKEVCMNLATSPGTVWNSLIVGVKTYTTLPISPATAATDCNITNVMTFGST
jgi:prepilin-type N-terminal cleavage/methylation domain-containing protein